jgi:hypothetical protein
MTQQQITTSAALYFEPQEREAIPLYWFERVRELLAEFDLSPVLFSAEGGGFRIDECYVLAEPGGDLVDEGQVLSARGPELVTALKDGRINSLGLDSPRSVAGGRSDWRVMADASLNDGLFYLGLDEELISDPAALLRRAYQIAKGFLDIRYAIAYKSPLADDPDCYAMGLGSSTISAAKGPIRSQFRDLVRSWHDGTHRKSADELWRDELVGRRRHLAGLFRGAFPVNILSKSHIVKADLHSFGIGRLTELDPSLWLWELSDSEILLAERTLEARGVLVRQAE